MNKKSYAAGAVESLGVTFAFLFLFISVGALCFRGGLSLWQSMGMTALIIAAPLQIVLLNHIATLTLWGVCIFSLIVNFRLFFMSASLVPYLRDEPFIKILFPIAGLSASSFSLTFSEYKTNNTMHHFGYFVGVLLGNYICAVLATGIGFLITSSLHSPYLTDVLSMILPINFAILTAKYWPKLVPVLATLTGFILMPFARELSPEWGMLVVGLVVGLIFLVILRMRSCTPGV